MTKTNLTVKNKEKKTPPPLLLSGLVVAHNEEQHLDACLSTLKFCDEIVIVLDKCTDDSEKIAKKFTPHTKIFSGEWESEGARRNFGREKCQGKWIIELDCDERIPAPLQQEIIAAAQQFDDGYFVIPFDNYIGTRRVRHGGGASWGVAAAARLSRNHTKKWGGERVHPSLTLLGPKRFLKNRILHYVDADIGEMIDRFNRYTQARSLDLFYDESKKTSYFRDFRRIFTRFIKCYIFRKGYREGGIGFLNACFAGLYPIVSHIRADFLKQQNKK